MHKVEIELSQELLFFFATFFGGMFLNPSNPQDIRERAKENYKRCYRLLSRDARKECTMSLKRLKQDPVGEIDTFIQTFEGIKQDIAIKKIERFS